LTTEPTDPWGSRPDISSDATRYLCVAAHLNEEFSTEVVTELFGRTERAVPPSYGFDIGAVAAHCLAARHRRRKRDVLIVAIGGLVFLLASLPMVVMGVVWWCVGRFASLIASRSPRWRDGIRWEPVLGMSFFLALVFTAILVVAAGMLARQSFVVLTVQPAVTTTKAVAAVHSPAAWLFTGGLHWTVRWAAGPTETHTLRVALVAGGMAAIGAWGALYGLVFGELLERRQFVVRELRQATFRARPRPDVPLSRRLRRRLDAVARSQSGNVTIYSEFDPFVGTGTEARVEGRQFAISLLPAPGHSGAVERFSVLELVDHVGRRIAEVAAPEDADPGTGSIEEQLPGLVVSDHVFVNGREVEGDQRFIDKRGASPRTCLCPLDVQRIARQPRGPVRHYCGVRVRSWSGEIMTFTFFHFSVAGDKLYLEWVNRQLNPVNSIYHKVNAMTNRPRGEELWEIVVAAAVKTVPIVATAPVRLLRDLVFDMRGEPLPQEAVIDYGAHVAIRDLATDHRCHNYFQELDATRYLRIVERRALAAIEEFLQAHGIDTAEFSNRKTSILNNHGVIQMGQHNKIDDVSINGRPHSQQRTSSSSTGQQ
jgi:hypothetical protein